MAEHIVELIETVTGKRRSDMDLEVQRLGRYVSVRLTQEEAERLASHEELAKLGLALPPMYRVWRNAKKLALLDKSIHAIQASPAHQAYQARGYGIAWAVLDSGCTPHPHFETHKTIAARWDCTKVSDTPLEDDDSRSGRARKGSSRKTPSTVDKFGHGTHVAGIIAGAHEFAADSSSTSCISGIAPLAKLHIYKVLNDNGEGDDAWIIKALDHIASINEKAGGPEIAGVNLSLGGEFEQGVFGCGHTPLCDELRRLWRQGVMVVLAAGNEGYRRIMSTDGDFGANVSCSIGDPANLDESIAVGAVHKEKPHTYGVSHFSSRGPTADGRSKPDCVAPGEQILSCRHDWNAARGRKKMTESQLYYKLDGTSMAAPHVSGLIACYLSVKREFIGQPDRVKRILLDNCTDLGRDRAMQGAGLPNLVKMLVQS
jgi:subtilisin family serine protease